MESKELREELHENYCVKLSCNLQHKCWKYGYKSDCCIKYLAQKIIKLKENMQKAIFEELSPRPEICHGCANKLLDRLKIKPKAIKKSLNEEKQDE